MKKRTELLFFFDTEDFTSNRSCDAIYDLATLFTEEGIRGHFALVGLVAKQLIHWDRYDVIDALKSHEIGNHTYGHSIHPNICEQTDIEDAVQACRNVLAEESTSEGIIKTATGVNNILFAVPPGNSKSYAAMYTYSDMGTPFYCDTVIEDAKGTPLYYCNQMHIGYTVDWEGWLMDAQDPDISGVLDSLAKRDRAIIYMHPNKAYFTEFWDSRNYRKRNMHPFGRWEACPERPKEQTLRFYARIRQVLRIIKADPRFKITTLPEILSEIKPRKPVTIETLPMIKQALENDFGPIHNPSLSVSDVFIAARDFLLGRNVYYPGKVYGFLEHPYGITDSVTVTAEALRKAAVQIKDGFLPASLDVSGTIIGPADFLFGALDILSNGADSVRLVPRCQMNSIQAFPRLETFSLKNTWLHSDELQDRYLSERLRLQAWTLRYE